MADIEDFIKAAEELGDVEVTPLTMDDVYAIYGETPHDNEDGVNAME